MQYAQTYHSFTPWLQPAIRVACVYEGWNAHQDKVIYRLLVPIMPSPGHTFHVALGDMEEASTRKYCLCVELECTCMREQMLGDMLCFLHNAHEELREKQEPSFLDTFCTGSYLHVGKSTRWLQNQVKAAWKHLPQLCDCHLELLPSHHSYVVTQSCMYGIHMVADDEPLSEGRRLDAERKEREGPVQQLDVKGRRILPHSHGCTGPK